MIRPGDPISADWRILPAAPRPVPAHERRGSGDVIDRLDGVDEETMGLVGIEDCLAVQFQRPHFSFALNSAALGAESRRTQLLI